MNTVVQRDTSEKRANTLICTKQGSLLLLIPKRSGTFSFFTITSVADTILQECQKAGQRKSMALVDFVPLT